MECLACNTIPFARPYAEYVFYFPSPTNTKPENSRTYSCFSRPFIQALTFAIELYESVRSSILLLLSKGSPSTIFRLVVPFSIRKSVQGFSLGSLSHIGKKIREFQPSFTNRNPLSSVAGVFRMIGVVASLDHACPSVVGGSAMKFGIVTVLDGMIRHKISLAYHANHVNGKENPGLTARRAAEVQLWSKEQA